jgi:hypothetical protein
VPASHATENLAGGDVERCVEARSAVPLAVVRAALDLPGPQRQHQRCAIESLDLGLLVDREHHRVARGIHVQADDIDDLLGELRC